MKKIIRKASKPTIVAVSDIVALDAALSAAVAAQPEVNLFAAQNQAIEFKSFMSDAYVTLSKLTVKAAKKARKSSIVKVMLSSAESATGKIELALISEAGISTEEMKAFRGAVAGLIPWYKKNGFTIEKRNNRFYCTDFAC